VQLPKPQNALRIVSLNTWKCDGDYPQRLRLMAGGLRALEPDIVLLQEVFRTLDGTWNTATHLADALQMDATCAWARRKNRLVRGQWQMSDSGMATLCKQSVLESWALELPAAPEDGDRVAQLLRLDFGGEALWLANLHLSHLPGAHDLRLAQWGAVLAHDALRMGSQSVWMLGDFNTPLSAGTAWLNPAQPWSAQDTFAQFQLADKTTHIDAAGVAHNLDQCLHLWKTWPGNWAAVNAQVVLQAPDFATGLMASDHAALCIDLLEGNAAKTCN
jgi:endonuclease/exonuclease/phosphatase family metal-dependent hydrolase